jgi:hypothetical protein
MQGLHAMKNKKETKKSEVPKSAELKPTSKSMTMADLVKLQNLNQDPKDKILTEMSAKLFDKDSILMISRLNQDMSYYITKHLIVRNFFSEYFQNLSYKQWLKPIKTKPYYEVKTEYSYGRLNSKLIEAYDKFILEICSLSISFNGESRKEIMSVLKTAEAKIMESEMAGKSSGSLGRILD